MFHDQFTFRASNVKRELHLVPVNSVARTSRRGNKFLELELLPPPLLLFFPTLVFYHYIFQNSCSSLK
ncbi:hypothetical protein H5410_023292 [Solanum commersonii]|uniref:Uncharacterized protein n=1 Tax=Solanum commersonii TaxID=4109 RepID=A0A9J5ZGF6_SOLCO|nr:hypothetical protein H5410_023292 [Solanum commersonii]